MLAASIVAASLVSLVAADVHQVTVGGAAPNTLLFQPEALSAAIGDTVVFTFKQKNHTVTQTAFGEVCHPLLNDARAPVSDSGFQPVSADQTDNFPTWNYTVAVDTPLWFYCAQAGHCGKGMVFSINCPYEGDHSFDNFKQSALAFGAAADQQAAAQSSWAATATSDVYGDHTYAPVYHPTVTDTITLGTDVWTTAYESYPNSPAPTPASPEGQEHRVIVGNNGALTFDPPALAAAPRDKIVFEFRSKNHTATQSSFGNPCRKLEFTSTTGQKGFDSGFQFVDPALTDNFPTYTVEVNDTAPVWIYCRQTNHCGQGMVFSVNADESSDRNHAAFEALAKTINGTASNNNNGTGQTSSDNTGAAPTTRAGMASAALLVVGSLFVLAF